MVREASHPHDVMVRRARRFQRAAESGDRPVLRNPDTRVPHPALASSSRAVLTDRGGSSADLARVYTRIAVFVFSTDRPALRATSHILCLIVPPYLPRSPTHLGKNFRRILATVWPLAVTLTGQVFPTRVCTNCSRVWASPHPWMRPCSLGICWGWFCRECASPSSHGCHAGRADVFEVVQRAVRRISYAKHVLAEGID